MLRARSAWVMTLAAAVAGIAVVALGLPEMADVHRTIALIASYAIVAVVGFRAAHTDLSSLALAMRNSGLGAVSEAEDEGVEEDRKVSNAGGAVGEFRDRTAKERVGDNPGRPNFPVIQPFSSAARAVPATSEPPPVRYGTGVTGALSLWTVVYRVGDCEGAIDLPVQREEIRVGRGPDNDLIVHHAEVGTTDHIRISISGKTLSVADMGFHIGAQGLRVEGSRNGSVLLYPRGAHVLRPRELCPWPPGVELVIPAASVAPPAGAAAAPVRVSLRIEAKRGFA